MEEVLAFLFAMSLVGAFVTINLKRKDPGKSTERIEALEKRMKEIESALYDKSLEMYDLKSQVKVLEALNSEKALPRKPEKET